MIKHFILENFNKFATKSIRIRDTFLITLLPHRDIIA